MIAAYRIDHDGWVNNRALNEALSFRMSSLQVPRQNYIRTFQPMTAQVKGFTASNLASSSAARWSEPASGRSAS